jgi:cytochrome c6
VCAEPASNDIGEARFKALCAMCHPNGENVINPKKTLHKAVRESNGVKTADDIVKFMRKPGPGMTIFNEKAVPQKEAQAIADYVIKTF